MAKKPKTSKQFAAAIRKVKREMTKKIKKLERDKKAAAAKKKTKKKKKAKKRKKRR